MATNFTLELDTTAPGSPTASINGGASATNNVNVTFDVGTSDGDTTGYTMKIWGDIDGGPASEGAASWVSFAASNPVQLTTGDGTKTLNFKVRDDVGNESTIASDSITLDTSAPTPNITSGPSATKISKVATFDTITVNWEADVVFEEYKIKVVANAGDPHTSGTQIPTAAGSLNVSGAAGGYPALTDIVTTIKGTDLETASAGDGSKIVKIFVRDDSNNWSV